MAKQLSEILLEQGTLDATQIKRAQLYAKQNNVSVAEAIVKFGFASEEQVTAALSKHFSVPYASKENGILVPEREQNLQEIIPEKFARENMVIPLFIEDDELAVAVLDPTNVFLLENITDKTVGFTLSEISFIQSNDTGGILSAMLQNRQSVIQ